MRTPKQRQHPLLHPLSYIFAAPANVRLIRGLALAHTPMTVGELAKRSQLGRTSTYPALHDLEKAGIVEFVGAGAQQQVQLRARHPLARPLEELFRAETKRFESFVVALRSLLADLPVRSMSAWTDNRIQNRAAEYTLQLLFVAHPEDIEQLTDLLNSTLGKVEREYDVHLAVHGLTRTELERLSTTEADILEQPVLLDGVPPDALLRRSNPVITTLGSHADHDARSRRLALAIAAKLRKDPGLRQVAETHVKRRIRKASAGEKRELIEWLRILSTMSAARLQALLREDSERATRLRQSLPALGLLSPTERNAIIQANTDSEAIAAVTRR